MTLGELNVEVRDESVNIVIPLNLQAEGRGERQILRLHRVDIHLLKATCHVSLFGVEILLCRDYDTNSPLMILQL